MKKAAALLILLSVSILLSAQVPDGFNYQAVARDGSNNYLPNAGLTVRVAIITDDAVPVTVWTEDHIVTTNDIGLFKIMIGDPTGTGTPGTASSFAEIDWTSQAYYLKVDIYYNSQWHDMGSAQLLSVPYAMLARHAQDNLGSQFMMNGDTVYTAKSLGIGTDTPLNAKLAVVGDDNLSEDALFEVRRQDGQPVFSVFNDGIRAWFNEAATGKSPKGGFAIGGFNPAKAGSVNNYMTITPDSIRMYVNDSPAKGPKGGFAIGSFGAAKAPASRLMHLTPLNYFIGHESGVSNTTGIYNTFFGYNAGFSNTAGNRGIFIGFKSGYLNMEGNSNSFIGNFAGYSNQTGYDNIFIGDSAGYFNNSGRSNVFIGNASGVNNLDGNINVFIGDEAGWSNTTGYRNTFVGTYAGWSNTTGHSNVFLGPLTGVYNTEGQGNIFIGRSAGYYNETGSDNIFLGKWSGINFLDGTSNVLIGTLSGRRMVNGHDNIFIGQEAGFNSDTSNANVFIGYAAGHQDSISYGNVMLGDHSGHLHSLGDGNVFLGPGTGWNNTDGFYNVLIGYYAGYEESGSNKLYIENSGADKDGALIYGEFDSDYLQLNATVNITGGLQLNGSSLFGSDPFAYNTFLGDSAGYSQTGGYQNAFFGSGAGYSNTDGFRNTFVGAWAGSVNSTGNNNVFIGRTAGSSNDNGNANTFIGVSAGYYNVSGTDNTAVGRLAGLHALGDANIFLGNRAGLNETGSERLYIENSDADPANALIYGEFDNDVLQLNAAVTIRDLMVLQPRSTPPASPVEGTLYYDSGSKTIKFWNGSAWIDL